MLLLSALGSSLLLCLCVPKRPLFLFPFLLAALAFRCSVHALWLWCELQCPVICGIWVPGAGIKRTSAALEARRLTTGPPGKVILVQSCPNLCDPRDCSPPGPSVRGILQARILEWVAIPFSRGSSWPRVRTWVSCITGRFFTVCATREAHHGTPQISPFNKGIIVLDWGPFLTASSAKPLFPNQVPFTDAWVRAGASLEGHRWTHNREVEHRQWDATLKW